MTFAVLAREAYAIFPASIAVGLIIAEIYKRHANRKTPILDIVGAIRLSWLQTIPMLFLLGWQIYINLRLSSFPKLTTSGLLGAPFINITQYFLNSARGETNSSVMASGHILTQTFPQYSQAIGLGLFLTLLISVLIVVSLTFRPLLRNNSNNKSLPLAACATVLVGLYACLGPIMVGSPWDM